MGVLGWYRGVLELGLLPATPKAHMYISVYIYIHFIYTYIYIKIKIHVHIYIFKHWRR